LKQFLLEGGKAAKTWHFMGWTPGAGGPALGPAQLVTPDGGGPPAAAVRRPEHRGPTSFSHGRRRSPAPTSPWMNSNQAFKD